jgi:predicted aminopeptidase
MQLAAAARGKLEALYASELDAEAMRDGKRQIFEALTRDAGELDGNPSGARNALGGTLNNARLASLGLYEGRVAAFKVILQDCADDLSCFYERAGGLAEMKTDDRDAELDRLVARSEGGA